MASFINTNMVSLNTQNNLNKSQSALAQSIHRLSTGLRINSAKDDASGVAIANRLESAIRGQTVAVRNTNDAISYSQYAEGALNQVFNNLQRMRELAVQSSNGVNGSSDRELLNTEFFQLQQEIDRIRNNTKFNGIDALGNTSLTIQTGAGTSSYDQIVVQGMDLSKVTSVSSVTAKVSTVFTKEQFETEKASIAKSNPTRANNLFFNSSNGHVYELVTAGKTYDTAVSEAKTSTFGGQNGYLATITSADENAFVYARTGGAWTWINGTDSSEEGKFVYSEGSPETGALTYKNFAGGEPNNWGEEDAVHLWGGGTWNDLNKGAGIWSVVEYGGNANATQAAVSASSQIKISLDGNKTIYQYQVKDGSTLTVAATNDKYLDSTGNLLAAGTLLSGKFVYIQGTATAAPSTPGTDVQAVNQESQKAQASDASIYGNASNTNILTQADSLNAISDIDEAMKQVNVAQIQQGATQNRLSAVISVLTSSTESLTRAKSNIMDTDYASETAVLARNQILQQAGIAMLAQANQLPNNIMTLLKG
jgi:flagellin